MAAATPRKLSLHCHHRAGTLRRCGAGYGMDSPGGITIAAVGALVSLSCFAAERWRSGGHQSPTATLTGAGDRVLLFYKYVAISDVDGTVRWMQGLASRLGLLGRVLLAEEGINGSVSGSAAAVREYIATMDANPLFSGIDWKDSSVGDGELAVEHGQAFSDLVVKHVKELVSTGGAVSLADVTTHGGVHLSPQEFHERVIEAQCSDETVLLDVRNTFESDIGRFKGATPVPMASFSEYTSYAESNLPELRGKKVLMYCTGGIRCEKASAYLRKRGVRSVSQLSGGIHRYLEAYPDGSDSAYIGKNFVFDRRMSQSTPGAQVIGRCVECEAAYDTYEPRKVRETLLALVQPKCARSSNCMIAGLAS